jgi:aquaporin Z
VPCPAAVGNDYTGWWVYVAGPVIGAAIAVMIIGLVRGLPDRAERQAAQGADLPMAGTGGPPPPERKDLPDGGGVLSR